MLTKKSVKKSVIKSILEIIKCSVTMDILKDPVILLSGNTYERADISTWFMSSNSDPVTNLFVSDKILIPNRALKSLIPYIILLEKEIEKEEKEIEEISKERSAAILLIEENERLKELVEFSNIDFGSNPDVFLAVIKKLTDEKKLMTTTLQEKEDQLNETKIMLAERNCELVEKNLVLFSQDCKLDKNNSELSSIYLELSRKNWELTSINKELADKDLELSDKDLELSSKDLELSRKDWELAKKNKELADKDLELSSKDLELSSKDWELVEKNKELAEKDCRLLKIRDYVHSKNKKNNELEHEIGMSRQIIDQLKYNFEKSEIKRLEHSATIKKMKEFMQQISIPEDESMFEPWMHIHLL